MRLTWWHGVFAAFLFFVAGFLATHGSGAAVLSDPSGYLNSARLLAEGKLTVPVRRIPGVPADTCTDRELSPLGFRLAQAPGSLVPTYPLGLPAHLVAASWLVGWDAAGILVNVVAAVAALVMMFLLARRFDLPPSWALASTLLFAVFPVTVRSFTWVMSDGLATSWCIAAVYFAMRATEGRRWAIAAGLSFAVSVLVRPSNALLIIALLAALPRGWRTLTSFVAGGLPVAVALGACNHAAYGAVMATGYREDSARFAVAYIGPRMKHFAFWISRFLTPVPLLLWIGGVVRAFRGDKRYIVLLAWILPTVVFYASYFHSLEAWWYLRFILPALPPILLGSTLFAHQATGSIRSWSWVSGRWRNLPAAAAAIVCISAIVLSIAAYRTYRLGAVRDELGAYPAAVALARSRVGPVGLIICKQLSGAVYFYSEYPVLRYDNTSKPSFQRVLTLTSRAHTPVFALVLDTEVKALEARSGVAFQEEERLGHIRLMSPTNGAPDTSVRR